MNKKIVAILLISMAIIIAGVFIYKDFIKNKQIILQDNENTIEDNKEPQSQQATTTKLTVPSLDRPLVFSNSVSKEEKAVYTQKLQELVTKLKNEPNDFESWIQLGNYRQAIEDYEGAKQAWEFASLLAPKNSISFYNLGQLYGYYLKDYPNSEQNYLRAIANNSQFFLAYSDLADIYWFNDVAKRGEIEGLLLKGIGIANGNNKVTLMARLARYYKDVGDNTSAVKYYEEILKIDPNNIGVKEEIDNLK